MATTRQRRGFASMDPQRQREIASLGGIAVQQQGKAHAFKRGQEASAAGKKGALARWGRVSPTN